jgi:hypothetical protein
MIQAGRRICRWLYNHNKLHAMMRAAIGGELVKWNATRFGTNYMFLESIHRQRDKFMTWVASPSVDASHAAPQAHGIINIALHREYSPCIVFIFFSREEGSLSCLRLTQRVTPMSTTRLYTYYVNWG